MTEIIFNVRHANHNQLASRLTSQWIATGNPARPLELRWFSTVVAAEDTANGCAGHHREDCPLCA